MNKSTHILSSSRVLDTHVAYRPDIDGLRAMAIISVVIYHAFPGSLSGGFVGVDVFFVISGFLISSIIFRGMHMGVFSFTDFFAHRIKRIFPALIVVLAACYAFGWFALLPDELKHLGKHMAAASGFVQNIALWQEAGYFDTASELKPLMHLWSLGVEEQFYLAFPVLIWAAWRARMNVLKMVVFLGLLSFALNVLDIVADPVSAFFLPQTRFWELLAGAVLAYLQLFNRAQIADCVKRCLFHQMLFRQPPLVERQDQILNNLISAFGLLLLLASMTGINKSMPFPGWWALAPVSGALLLIAAGPHSWVNRQIFANKPMVFIGLISYPLYLWHWPILSFARIVESEMPSAEVRMAAIAITFMLAWLTYRLIEAPIRFGRNARVKTVALAIALTALGCGGYGAFMLDGMEFRMERNRDFLHQLQWEERDGASAECREFIGQKDLGYCLRSPGKLPDAVLIGDSHANSLYRGLSEAYAKDGRSLINLGGGGCLPFFDTDYFLVGEESNPIYCRRWMGRSLEFALSSPSVKQIILSFFATRNMHGDISGMPEAKAKVVRFAQQPDLRSHETFAAAFRHTLSRLVESEKKIFVVIDWPELGFEPKTCLESRPFRINARAKQSCSVDRIAAAERNNSYSFLVSQLKSEYPTVTWLETWPYLCDSTECTATPDGRLAYRDPHHLSMFGSEFLAKKISHQLLEGSW